MFAVAADVQLLTTRVFVSPPTAQQPLRRLPIQMIIRQDGIALENDETFTLSFIDFPKSRFGVNDTIRDTMNGTVLDGTGEDIELY